MLSEYIVKTPGTCGGKPRLKDRRVRVQDISCYSEWWGWSADRIASELDISLAQVHAALAYYFDNIEEIRIDIKTELETYERAKAANPSKLTEKLEILKASNPKSA